MSYRHEVVIEEIRGFSVPILVWVSPVIALLIGAALYRCSTFVPFCDLVVLIVIPIWAALTALALRPQSDGRRDWLIVAVVSFGIGAFPAILGWVDLSPTGFQVMAVERNLDHLEAEPSGSGELMRFESTPKEVLARLSPEDKRRSSILLAREKNWRASLALWRMASAAHFSYGDEEIESAMARIVKEGVSQYQLIRICMTLQNSGMHYPAVRLWREYYPRVSPDNWHDLLDQYSDD